MDFYDKPSLEDLQHYGVKGMRWGIRRKQNRIDKLKKQRSKYSGEKRAKIDAKLQKAKTDDKVYKKANKKLSKLDERALSATYTNLVNSSPSNMAYRDKRIKRAKKWADAMADAFKNDPVSSLKVKNNELVKKYIDVKTATKDLSIDATWAYLSLVMLKTGKPVNILDPKTGKYKEYRLANQVKR